MATASSAGRAGSAVLQATGYVTAKRQATVATQITSTLTQVLIGEGDVVKPGQVIARLDDTALRATLNAAQAPDRGDRRQCEPAAGAAGPGGGRRQAHRQALAAQGVVSKQVAEQSRTSVTTLKARWSRPASRPRPARPNWRRPRSTLTSPWCARPLAASSPPRQPGGRNHFAAVGRWRLHPHRGGHHRGHGFAGGRGGRQRVYIAQVQPGMPVESVLQAYPDWRIPPRHRRDPHGDRGKATVRCAWAWTRRTPASCPIWACAWPSCRSRTRLAPSPMPSAASGVLLAPTSVVERDGKKVVYTIVDGRAAQRGSSPPPSPSTAKTVVTQGLRPVTP